MTTGPSSPPPLSPPPVPPEPASEPVAGPELKLLGVLPEHAHRVDRRGVEPEPEHLAAERFELVEVSVHDDVNVHRRAGLGIDDRGEGAGDQVRQPGTVQRSEHGRDELGEAAHYVSEVRARRSAPAALICAASSDISMAISMRRAGVIDLIAASCICRTCSVVSGGPGTTEV